LPKGTENGKRRNSKVNILPVHNVWYPTLHSNNSSLNNVCFHMLLACLPTLTAFMDRSEHGASSYAQDRQAKY